MGLFRFLWDFIKNQVQKFDDLDISTESGFWVKYPGEWVRPQEKNLPLEEIKKKCSRVFNKLELFPHLQAMNLKFMSEKSAYLRDFFPHFKIFLRIFSANYFPRTRLSFRKLTSS